MSTTPEVDLVKLAQKAHPGFKLAIAIAGIAALVALVAQFKIGLATVVVGVAVFLVLMAVFAVVARAEEVAKKNSGVVLAFVWGCVLLLFATVGCLLGSVFFDQPLPLRAVVLATFYPVPTPSSPASEPGVGDASFLGSPEVVYRYQYSVGQSVCNGSFEKYADRWLEQAPSDEMCNHFRFRFVQLARDDKWFYLYDSQRNLTGRIPVGGGVQEWTMGRITPTDAKWAIWQKMHQVARASG